LILAGGGGALALLAACQGAAPQAPAPATEAPLAARTMAPASVATSAPVAAKPEPTAAKPEAAAAKPASAAAPAVKGPEPKGKFVEGFNATIPPAWLDPQENPSQATPYNFDYALHDAMLKHMPGQQFAPSLAESYDIAPDFKSATFKLRKGIKFHDGSPVTPEDVKFTYENYRGAGAKILKDKLEKIDLPDDRTIKFFFKEPFVDFQMLYGSPASGAGWIVPKAYYEKVGKDGFKTAPIGAGPYRFVKRSGNDLELEAFPDYWRKSPNVKSLIFRGVSETPTRVAMVRTGDVDASVSVEGELIASMKADPNLRLTAVKGGTRWLETMSLDSPDHPLKDIRVRQAVHLAIDREAINQAEMGGMSPIEGNWIPEDFQGALKRPVPQRDVAKAKQLLAEAGVPNGFEISQLTPLPPFFSWGERVLSHLREVGIKTSMNTMERGVFYEKLAPGPNRLKGLIVMFSAGPGDAASRIRESAITGGTFSGLSMPEIDDRMKQYEASTDQATRKKLIEEVQAFLLDQYIMIPLPRGVTVNAFGPRLASKPEEVSGVIPQFIWVAPYEDIQVKD
jgi:peptide/nickel transport system substrate-binding protein